MSDDTPIPRPAINGAEGDHHRCHYPVEIASVQGWRRWWPAAATSLALALLSLALPLGATCRSVGAAEQELQHVESSQASDRGDIRVLREDLVRLERENASARQQQTEILVRLEGRLETLRVEMTRDKAAQPPRR